MESFALFHNASQLGKKAACLLTISDNLVTHALTTSEERQTAFSEMMKIALELAQ
jgi:purine-nucleoside phosphorylase